MESPGLNRGLFQSQWTRGSMWRLLSTSQTSSGPHQPTTSIGTGPPKARTEVHPQQCRVPQCWIIWVSL